MCIGAGASRICDLPLLCYNLLSGDFCYGIIACFDSNFLLRNFVFKKCFRKRVEILSEDIAGVVNVDRVLFCTINRRSVGESDCPVLNLKHLIILIKFERSPSNDFTMDCLNHNPVEFPGLFPRNILDIR